MCYTDPGDSEEMAEAWQTFLWTELSKYTVMLHFGLNLLGKKMRQGWLYLISWCSEIVSYNCSKNWEHYILGTRGPSHSAHFCEKSAENIKERWECKKSLWYPGQTPAVISPRHTLYIFSIRQLRSLSDKSGNRVVVRQNCAWADKMDRLQTHFAKFLCETLNKRKKLSSTIMSGLQLWLNFSQSGYEKCKYMLTCTCNFNADVCRERMH